MVPYQLHTTTLPFHTIPMYGPYMAQGLPYDSHSFSLVRVIEQDSPHSDSSEDEIYSAVEFNELGLVKCFTIHSRIVFVIIVIISH